MWWKKNKWKVIVPALVVIALAAAFWYGGGSPGSQGWSVGDNETVDTQTPPDEADVESKTPQEAPKQEELSADTEEPVQSDTSEETEVRADASEESNTGADADPDEGTAAAPVTAETDVEKDAYQTDPVPEGKPQPVEPQEASVTDTAYTCTLSISCATVGDHLDWLDPEKAELIPEDGWILSPTTVTFYEGESVFNVLQRTCKQQKIHMEFENTPMYNSAYIEGINNLYEFDCGELSGWMYKVNGWFPNYGCSRYQLQNGDVVEWVYTCDLGADVGGDAASRGAS